MQKLSIKDMAVCKTNRTAYAKENTLRLQCQQAVAAAGILCVKLIDLKKHKYCSANSTV